MQSNMMALCIVVKGKSIRYDGICNLPEGMPWNETGRPMLRHSQSRAKAPAFGLSGLGHQAGRNRDQGNRTEHPQQDRQRQLYGRVLCAMPRRHRMSHRQIGRGVGLRHYLRFTICSLRGLTHTRKACIEPQMAVQSKSVANEYFRLATAAATR